MKRNLIYLTIITAIICSACTNRKTKYVIGVSQCSEDIWRDWQNSEMMLESTLHDGVELRFTTARDDSKRQIQQIDSLVESGIQLLIVAPNQLASVTPAINRAYNKGIPVIVFERKTDSPKYTAFVSADNYEIGHIMGDYVVMRLKGKGRVIEILGLKGSSPAEERHKGFTDALKDSGIEIVATLQSDWTEERGYEAMKNYKGNLANIDLVFAHNDRSAIGARRAFLEAKIDPLPLFCGIDGLPGKNGGIQMVRDEILDASYIYPTRGDQLLKLALDILDGEPYEKETMLTSAIVTSDNANVLMLESDEVMRQSLRLARLKEKTDAYIQKLSTQRIISFLAVILVFLLIIMIVGIYYHFLQQARIIDERNRMEREKLDFYTQVSHELRTPLTLIQGPLEELTETKEAKNASPETKDLYRMLRRNTNQLIELINKMLDVQATGSLDILAADTQNTVMAPTATNLPTVPKDGNQSNSILIVDDNADIRTLLRRILQNRYQVNEADDGQQGLLLANEIVPDLIVSDVMMPVMNGLEFCQRVKSNIATSHIPVILLTARALSKHQVEGYESGADAYITKPFSAEVLLARIDNLLKNRLRLKDLFGNEEPQVGLIEEPQIEEPQKKEDTFMIKFRDFIEQNMSDSELGVENIGAELGLSRVQLYRKVKALTGQSPVELLRTARLHKARRLLQGSDKSISEVAYEVGFTAPSYFTKCFKDEFGVSPSDLTSQDRVGTA
jgi:ABC-type sugar transport system substrate-binding protein/DNA-binding response OmpR family regulator